MKIYNLLQKRTKQTILQIVAGLDQRLSSNNKSRRQRNHELTKSGIPKRKKTDAHPRLSCKIDYLLSSNHSHASITSEFFTDDERARRSRTISLDTRNEAAGAEALIGREAKLPMFA